MEKKHFYILFIIFAPAFAMGQVVKFKKNWEADPSDNVYSKGRFYLMADYGANNLIKQTWTKVDDYGAYTDKGIGIASIKLEYALKQKWSVLVGASYFSGEATWRVAELDTNKETILYDKGFQYASLTYFAGLNTHIFTSPTVDIYLGAQGGYTTIDYKPFIGLIDRTDYEVPKALEPWYYNTYFGLRLNYSKKSGIYMEAGQGSLNNICAGLVYRFGL